MAYATIRREISRRGIMIHASSSGKNPSEIESGLAVKHHRSDSSSRRDMEDMTHLKCSYCGGNRHTKEGCFKLIGYPEVEGAPATESRHQGPIKQGRRQGSLGHRRPIIIHMIVLECVGYIS